MSETTIQSDLFVELSAESQELLSGGQQLQLGGPTRPDITVIGTLIDSRGQRIPVRIFGFVAGPPAGGGGPFGGGGSPFGGGF
ncbi:hypothetical protein [Nodularia sp. UHCC 0506]|uniref:hypothetical protein n=1 Tax=Nodularia sp. UHCC 0506 TaxID=3110243 RepID=UPI002B21DB4F|nr:hypothetical protein [Nodularia sp. UHCC 0506]MEA5516194.1 hypothetical protein [Nodularia sp. UHCC 0506]